MPQHELLDQFLERKNSVVSVLSLPQHLLTLCNLDSILTILFYFFFSRLTKLIVLSSFSLYMPLSFSLAFNTADYPLPFEILSWFLKFPTLLFLLTLQFYSLIFFLYLTFKCKNLPKF